MIDHKKFFDIVRNSLFGGKLTSGQFRGMEAIIKEWDSSQGCEDIRWLAYMLATTHHETARTMQPIEEYGKGKNYPYGKISPDTGKAYYGRGFVQLTWITNYIKMGKILGVDLLHKPELALDLEIATKILFHGMKYGSFTGKKLIDYFNEKTEDWINARRIINGTDRAALIAEYAKKYYEALKLAVT